MRLTRKQGEALNATMWTLVGAMLFFICQTIVQDPEPELDTAAAQYLPGHLGQKTVLWLEDRDGVLHLNWEKHAQADWPNVPPATQIACPVRGLCGAINVQSVN
jgi:hypothetical protein